MSTRRPIYTSQTKKRHKLRFVIEENILFQDESEAKIDKVIKQALV